MSLSTHVLDATAGHPGVGVTVTFERQTDQGWVEVSERNTDSDGRIDDLCESIVEGIYRLIFDADAYFDGETFYPEVVVTFRVSDPTAHHHVPLLLSPWAYTTYRGS